MKRVRVVRTVALCVLLLMSQSVWAAALWTGAVQITAIDTITSNANVFVDFSPYENTQNCSDGKFRLREEKANYKLMLTMLLMAQAARLEIKIRTDNCNGIYNDISAIRIESPVSP